MKLSIPESNDPLTAQEFVKLLDGINRFDREELVLKSLIEGNVPSHMREFVDVIVAFKDESKNERELVLRVLPDGLCVGTDTDYVRIATFPTTAQKIADEWNCVLPTTKIVDIVWKNAINRLSPQPWGPPYDESMTSTERFVAQNKKIEDQISRLRLDRTKLTAGHKKDVVLTNDLQRLPNRVAIYGWHRLDGSPIQGLYLGHTIDHCDYSHEIRMVSRECVLDGKTIDIVSVLTDPNTCRSISKEGIMKIIRQPSPGV